MHIHTRKVKGGFWINETLAELTAEARLLFIGLWMVADRRGVIEDRPARIRSLLFPYGADWFEAALDELLQTAFIHRYESGGSKMLLVPTLTIHQTFHQREGEYELPPPPLPLLPPAARKKLKALDAPKPVATNLQTESPEENKAAWDRNMQHLGQR